MRVAKVRFNNNKDVYDYICDIKDVKEGDVVQVEDQMIPFFVYGISDEELKPGTIYKRVLKKLKENDKVTISTRYMNIIDSDCDCIVNSLGTNTSVFGAICKSIVTAAKSKEIEQMLKEYPTGKVFDYHVTDAGELKSKKIIHIVMPFRKNDKFNKDLKKAFSIVIDEAISLGMKSIAIPCIGTGANGYSKKDIYEAIDDVMFKYIYTPDIEIDIQSIMYGSTEKQKRRQVDERIMMDNRILCDYSREPDKFEIHFNPKNMQENVRAINRLVANHYNKYDELEIKEDTELFFYKTSFSFIDNAIQYAYDHSCKTTKEITLDLKKYYHRKNDFYEFRNNIKNKKPSKKDVFNMSVAMGLNFTQFIQFMTLSGFTFSPLRDANNECVDLIILKYALENEGFTKGLNDFIFYVNTTTKNKDLINYLCPVPKESKEKVTA